MTDVIYILDYLRISHFVVPLSFTAGYIIRLIHITWFYNVFSTSWDDTFRICLLDRLTEHLVHKKVHGKLYDV